MRRYAPKITLLLMAALLLGLAFAGPVFGQEEPPKKAPKGLLSIVLGNVDFVFVVIMTLSVIGLTLIIQGFIKNRSSVFMPETSTATIREMISQKKFKELIEFTENDPSFVS